MFENYLLDPRAIRAVLMSTEGGGRECTEEAIPECIDACMNQSKYFQKDGRTLPHDSNWVQADRVLGEVFRKLADLEYLKTVHSAEITEWLIENAPEDLADIADMLRRVLAHPALPIAN
jgi:hypothetical protein